jgi:DNA-binding NtrC family response regulator
MLAGTERLVKSILVVGGPRAELQLLDLVLSQQGFTVFLAATAANALRLCRQHLPTLALIELDFSSINSWHLLGELVRVQPDIRICVMGSERPAPGSKAWQALAQFIAKPFTLAELTEALERTLEETFQ